MPETIPTDNLPLVDPPRQTVWTSPRLKDPEWTLQPRLWLLELDRSAAPQVDQAHFEYDYGPLISQIPASFAPQNVLLPQLDIIGHFVKVEITDRAGGLVCRWYGLIEIEANDCRGLSLLTGSQWPAGRQTFHAFGLLRLLERVYFRSATKFQHDEESAPITLARGIPFNLSEEGGWAEEGNRSTAATDGGVYLFSDAPDLEEEWTAFTAARYLLTYHVPEDGYGNPLAKWELSGDPAILNWYVIHERTEGRSVKELLDALIPRKRAVGFWVDYDEEQGTVYLNLFSINGADLVLPTGTIPANPDQRALDFETAISIEKALLKNVVTTQYNEVIARGEPRSSTLTLRFAADADEFVPGWADELELDYLAGAADMPGYDSLSRMDRYAANARIRATDRFHPVYRRFQLSDDWNLRTVSHFQEEDTSQWIAFPLLDLDLQYRRQYQPGVNETGNPVWARTLRICPLLTLRQDLDYSGARISTGAWTGEDDQQSAKDTHQYLRPLFFWWDAAQDRFHLLENLAQTSAFETDNRAWSVQAAVLGRGPVFDLQVMGGPQQFLADSAWVDAADTDPLHDPAKNGGLDFTGFFATVTIDTGEPLERSIVIQKSPAGAQHRKLYIDVPDARLDYVVPFTVIGFDAEGPIQSGSGGFIRDDRPRLELIAKSAAEWYGKLRQTLEVTFRKFSPVVELGALITEIPSHYARENVNTVVTRVSYHFTDPRQPAMAFETSFPEFDLL